MYPEHSPQPDPTLAHRRAAATITLRRPDGEPLSDAVVTVERSYT